MALDKKPPSGIFSRGAAPFVTAAGLLLGGGDAAEPPPVNAARAPQDTFDKAEADRLIKQLKARVEKIDKTWPAREKMEGLIKELGDEDFQTREKASAQLREIGHPAIKYVKKALDNEDIEVRTRAKAIYDLIENTRDTEAGHLSGIVTALGKIAADGHGAELKEIVPLLSKVLKVDSQDLQQAAATTLGNIGPDAKEAVPALIGILKNKDNEQDVRRIASAATVKIGAEATAVDGLIILLKDDDFYVRRDTAQVLGNIKPVKMEAVNALEKALQDKNDTVREQTIIALGKMGTAAKTAVPGLITAMKIAIKDEYFALAHETIAALGSIAPDAKEDAIPALKEVIKNTANDKDTWRAKDLKERATKAIETIEGASQKK